MCEVVARTHHRTIPKIYRFTATFIPKVRTNSLPNYKKDQQQLSYTMYSLWTHSKSANTHLVLLLVVLGGKSKNTVTFSDRLLVLHPVQSSVEDITGEMGLQLVHKEVIIISASS